MSQFLSHPSSSKKGTNKASFIQVTVRSRLFQQTRQSSNVTSVLFVILGAFVYTISAFPVESFLTRGRPTAFAFQKHQPVAMPSVFKRGNKGYEEAPSPFLSAPTHCCGQSCVAIVREKMSASDDSNVANGRCDRSETSFPLLSASVGDQALALIGSSTSTVVSLSFFAAMAYRRDAYMISFFVGSILNAVLTKILKRVLNYDRPEQLSHVEEIQIEPSDKGMPSSHAASLGFIGTFIILGLPSSYYGIVLPMLAIYVVMSLLYRVRIRLHTPGQVYVGLFLGAGDALLWHFFFTSRMESLLSTTVLLPSDGVLPAKYLLVPAAVGAAVVGSFERRISLWMKTNKSKDG